MRRRKLLISIGALGAGGTAAFGTEAFTSVEAERNVDIAVTGDQSAFLAIQPLSGDNAEDYVSVEDSDSTVALNFDGDNSGPGEGVNQDAITQVEDLFRVVNQGTQPSSVYFEEDSSAVTFRVTKSADTETTGSSGQSLEGTSNSVELDVGEQVVVGITIDTLDNGVSGSLIDSVTIHAEAGAAAPEQNIAQPQYVVDPAADTGASDAGNVFQTVQSAVNAADAGAVIGIKNTGQETLDPGSSIEITTNDLTLGGFEGVPTIDGSGTTADTDAIVELDDGVSGITITDITIDYGSKHAISQVGGGDNNQVDNVTIDGTVLTSTDTGTESNAIDISGANISLTNNDVTGGGIQIQHDGTSGSDLQIVGNDVSGDSSGNGVLDEGIVVFNSSGGDLSDDNLSIDITDNRVRDTESASDLKLESSPADVNGASDRQSQIKSILNENDLGSIEVPAGTVSTTVSPQFNRFSSLQDAINTADSGSDVDPVTLVESGSYTELVTVDVKGLTLEAAEGSDENPEIESFKPQGADDPSEPAILVNADNVTINSIDAVEGIAPRNNQDVIEIADGVSGTTLANLAVESPEFAGSAGSTGEPVIGVPSGEAISDITIRNVTADRSIGLVANDSAEIVLDNVTATKTDKGEAVFITGPSFGPADVDLTIESLTPQENEEETGGDDLLLFGSDATVSGVDGDATVLANEIFDQNPNVDQVTIDEEQITRD